MQVFTNFLPNKYTTWYLSIISKAKERVNLIDGERHHIIPSSIGGSNTKDNLVMLTHREHFICHLLLTKMTEGKFRTKMCYAIKFMLECRPDQSRYIPSSKLVEIAKLRFIEARKGYTHSTLTKDKIANSMKGNTNKLGKSNSLETNMKISEALRGKPSIRSTKPIVDDKLNLAKTLLTTNLHTSEIAKSCGFSQVTNFSTWFKKASGLTPLQFRGSRSRS